MKCKYCGNKFDPREEEKIFNKNHKYVTYTMMGFERLEICLKCKNEMDKVLTDKTYLRNAIMRAFSD